MAFAHRTGQGVTKDTTKAADWCRKAAAQGHAGCLQLLSELSALGEGIDKDDKQALAWAKEAAEHGSRDALAELALRHLEGRGVEKDEAAALTYFRRAAKLRHAGFSDVIAEGLLGRDVGARDGADENDALRSSGIE